MQFQKKWGGGVVLEAKLLEAKYGLKLNWNFLGGGGKGARAGEGGGGKTKNLL